MSKREDIDRLNGLVNALAARITALEQAAKTQPAPIKSGRWKPEIGGRYWWISANSDVTSAIWRNDRNDQCFWSHGNVYQTEAAAQYADDRAVALQAMHDWALARFTPDWENQQQKKWAPHYREARNGGGWYVLPVDMSRYSDWPVFATEADFTEFMAEFGDRMFYLLERTKP